MTKLDSILKSVSLCQQTSIYSKLFFFPVVMYRYESWTIKNTEHLRIDAFKPWCWRRLLKSPLDCKEIQPVHSKGNQSWTFIGRTDAEAETPILWSPDGKRQFIRKHPNPGKDWGTEEKGATEDEMVGWHHWPNGHELGQTLGHSEGQKGLAYRSPWGCRVRHDLVTEQQQHIGHLWVLTNDSRMPGFQSYSPWILGRGCSQQHTHVCLSWINSTFLLKPGRQDSSFAL